MHQEAYEGFGRMLAMTGIDRMEELDILDVGGADVNGSVRDYFPNAHFSGLDIEPAPGVDYVFDAAESDQWAHIGVYDVVIATELFEHAERWADIIANMSGCLSEMGHQLLIATCASNGRPPHGARGEWGVPAGQFYGNVGPEALRQHLEFWFHEVHVEYNPNPGDAYMWARGVRTDGQQ